MPRHCTPVLPWCDSMRVVASCCSGDLVPAELPQPVRFAVPAFLSIPATERFALFVDAPIASSDGLPVVDGVILLQIKVVENTFRLRHTATIHAIGVREAAQNKGVGSALLMRAVDLAVNYSIRDSTPGDFSWSPFSWRSYVEFFLARGPCLLNWDVLLLLCNHGWCVRRHGHSPSLTSDMSPSDIRYHRAQGAATSSMALVIRGPSISLDGPLLYPGVQSGRALFKSPSELADPPPSSSATSNRTRDRWDCSYSINSAIRRGTLALSQSSSTYPLPGTGLLPFTASLLECQKLESYLEDSSNHSYGVDVGEDGEKFYTHTLHCTVGRNSNVILKGYHMYGTLNGKHDPALQSARTLKTFSKASIRAVVEELPGCAGILQAAMSRLGHGDISVKELSGMVKHVHLLLLDSTSQVDFGWHEDTYDLYIQDNLRDTLLSVIVQLSATFTTAMQLHGFAYHEYGGQGSGVIFHGRAVHRSIPRIRVPPHCAVWKIAFFVDARQFQGGPRKRPREPSAPVPSAEEPGGNSFFEQLDGARADESQVRLCASKPCPPTLWRPIPPPPAFLAVNLDAEEGTL